MLKKIVSTILSITILNANALDSITNLPCRLTIESLQFDDFDEVYNINIRYDECQTGHTYHVYWSTNLINWTFFDSFYQATNNFTQENYIVPFYINPFYLIAINTGTNTIIPLPPILKIK